MDDDGPIHCQSLSIRSGKYDDKQFFQHIFKQTQRPKQPKPPGGTVGHIRPHVEDLIACPQIQRPSRNDRGHIVDVTEGAHLLAVAEDCPGTARTGIKPMWIYELYELVQNYVMGP